jgi:LmbE family N-acetylglucosaminyl deacetylase
MLLATHQDTQAAEAEDLAAGNRLLKVVCVGAHPDDPESGCGGTLARYAAGGHAVTVIYLTRGEAGIAGKWHEEAAAIRTAEAETACKILGAKPAFAGQIDGATEINRDRAQSLLKLLTAEEPDVVFTHWPIDTHPDHQAASLLTLRAYLASRKRFPLYFFEVNSGSQTLGFGPTAYVDITATRDKKLAALLAHKSQNGEGIWREHHEIMATFRGRELGVAAAEAFAGLARDSRSGRLPGL